MKKVLIALEILIILLIGGGLLFIYSGVYNMAATEPTGGMVRWILETTRDRSVGNHAEDVQVPDLENVDKREGLRMFHQMCVRCHGAPGVERQEFAEGLDPQPPQLSRAVNEWTTAELYWIVRHGLKMTGMPGFGPTHSEEQLWAIVAFLRTLPDIEPEEYQTLQQGVPGAEGGHEHQSGEGEESQI